MKSVRNEVARSVPSGFGWLTMENSGTGTLRKEDGNEA